MYMYEDFYWNPTEISLSNLWLKFSKSRKQSKIIKMFKLKIKPTGDDLYLIITRRPIIPGKDVPGTSSFKKSEE